MAPVILSFTEENYLKAIYTLSEKDKTFDTSTNRIAEKINTKPSTVTDMLRKLTVKKLVTYEKYKKVQLTKTGEQMAILIIRKHRLWEVFLHGTLKFGWDEVHDIAEQLEHIHSEQLILRLENFLKYPKYDPHGDPIPSANGKLVQKQRSVLSEIDRGKSLQVVGVRDTSAVFLQYLKQLKIAIGTKIKVVEKIAYDGSLIISFKDNNQLNVSRKFSENILVSVIS